MLHAQDQINSSPQKLYDKALAGSQQLFNGTEYIKYRSYAGEHPFFLTEQYIVGSLKYDGVIYPAVPLYFDIAKNLLITPYYFDGTWMSFISELVEEFEIQTYHFRYLGDQIKGIPEPGFYELLYSGKTISLWMRHAKVYEESIEGMEVLRQFKYLKTYYLMRGNEAARLNENEKFPEIFKDKKPELRVFSRKNPKATLIDMVRFYDSLK